MKKNGVHKDIHNTLKALGFSNEKTAELTADTIHLINEFAKENNISYGEVFVIFKNALIGELSGLILLDVRVDRNSINNKAVEMGLASNNETVNKKAFVVALLELLNIKYGD